MSLIFGGLFDAKNVWITPHDTHRIGKDADIRTELYYYDKNAQLIHKEGVPIRIPRKESFNYSDGKTINPNSILVYNPKFEEICKKNNGFAKVHSPYTTNEHYHIKFN